MKGKILFLAGTAAGFVLGSKAGRQAYERIKAKTKQIWGDPSVQKAVSQAGQAARDAASLAGAKISDAVEHATGDAGHHEHGNSATGETPDVGASAPSMPSTQPGFPGSRQG